MDTDDPASVGVGKKMEKKKEVFSWFCTDLEAWDWERHLGESAWSTDRGVLGEPVSLFAPHPAAAPRAPQWGAGEDNLCCSERCNCVRTGEAFGGSEVLP